MTCVVKDKTTLLQLSHTFSQEPDDRKEAINTG